VSETWIVVVGVAALAVAAKAAGPVLLGRRPLPPRVYDVVELLAPAMLAALVVVQTVGGDRQLVLDERLAGVAAAAVALWRGASLLPAMVVAAAVAALLRLFA
jgi:branched-subunit amino acid transport protein